MKSSGFEQLWRYANSDDENGGPVKAWWRRNSEIKHIGILFVLLVFFFTALCVQLIVVRLF